MDNQHDNYAVVNSKGKVTHIIVWDGISYDREKSPRGLQKDAFPGCTLVKVDITPTESDNYPEVGGTYNSVTKKFKRLTPG